MTFTPNMVGCDGLRAYTFDVVAATNIVYVLDLILFSPSLS